MVLRRMMVLGLILAGFAAHAQEAAKPEAVKKKFRPDFPGSILVEFGFNFKNGITPPDFSKSFWGSRTFNVYYQYQIRLFKSSFSFNPGIGLSLERWKFDNNYTLAPTPAADGTWPLVPAASLYPGNINRCMFVNNYLEAPIEFRYDTNPEDIARSFNVAIGGRFGVLYDSFMKIDYDENGENKSVKEKQWHGMNQFRYGVYSRIGISGFSLFCYYNISPMWQPDKGPVMTTMNSVTVGISINGF